jgi:large subunit ribosomal protein L25
MAQQVVAARVRMGKGKGMARKLRENNQVPAIFYGPNTEPIMLTVDYPEIEKLVKQGVGGENIILDLEVTSEQGVETRKAILKELQVSPIKDNFVHADFYEISMDKEITVDIPIRLLNTPLGVAKGGGILQHITRELTVSCLPGRLIDSLDVDVSHLEIGDSIHVKDIELPEGITSTEEGDLTVAIVAAPAIKAAEGEAEEVEEETEEKAKEESTEPESEDS